MTRQDVRELKRGVVAGSSNPGATTGAMVSARESAQAAYPQ